MTFDEEVNAASKWEEEVSRLYDLALSEPDKANGGNLALTNAVVSEFLSATDIDVSDFSYVLEADGIRHAHKRHSGRNELLHGQIPIVKQDFLSLRVVMNDPDSISLASAGRFGAVRVEVSKNVLGYTLYCVFEVRRGKKKLALVTLYKRRTR